MSEGIILNRNLRFYPIEATGGNIEEVVINKILYRIHTFTDVGTSEFEVSSAGTSGKVDYLIVGGGGGGGKRHGGGGGAGGLVFNSDFIAGGSYTIQVGGEGQGAGPGVTPTKATNGGNSSAFGKAAIGGGAGASFNGSPNDQPNSGGSGGGAADLGVGNDIGAAATQPGTNAGVVLEAGNKGGDVIGNPTWPGGGGGGAGGVGGNAEGSQTGGVGLDYSSFFGTSVGDDGWFAGGGGGSPEESGSFSGGKGGGGAGRGDNIAGSNAMANTGGGGGGARSVNQETNIRGGNGGSGIVIIRYPLQRVA